jgi:hypothetical protein
MVPSWSKKAKKKVTRQMVQSPSAGLVVFLRDRKGVPICDTCIRVRLSMKSSKTARLLLTDLAATSDDFNRTPGKCGVCRAIRYVTTHTPTRGPETDK